MTNEETRNRDNSKCKSPEKHDELDGTSIKNGRQQNCQDGISTAAQYIAAAEEFREDFFL